MRALRSGVHSLSWLQTILWNVIRSRAGDFVELIGTQHLRCRSSMFSRAQGNEGGFGSCDLKYPKLSVHKVEGHALVSIQKSYKLSEVGRCRIIVDSTVIPMIGKVQCVDPEPKMMSSTTFAFEERHPERAIRLEVQ